MRASAPLRPPACDPVKVWSAGRRSRGHHRFSRAENHVRRGTGELWQRDCWRAGLADVELRADRTNRGNAIRCQLAREHLRCLLAQRVQGIRAVGHAARCCLGTADDHHQQLVAVTERQTTILGPRPHRRHRGQDSEQRYRRRMWACALRPVGPACRGTSVPDPATCKPVCRTGPSAAAACSRPSTTTGRARDAGRPGRAHPGGTAPSRGLSGQTPDSGAGRPADQQEGTPSRADLLSSAESSPPLSAVRLAWRPQRRSGGIGSGMRLQDHPTPCRRVARQPRAYPRPGGYRLREQATNPPFRRRKTIPNGVGVGMASNARRIPVSSSANRSASEVYHAGSGEFTRTGAQRRPRRPRKPPDAAAAPRPVA